MSAFDVVLQLVLLGVVACVASVALVEGVALWGVLREPGADDYPYIEL